MLDRAKQFRKKIQAVFRKNNQSQNLRSKAVNHDEKKSVEEESLNNPKPMVGGKEKPSINVPKSSPYSPSEIVSSNFLSSPGAKSPKLSPIIDTYFREALPIELKTYPQNIDSKSRDNKGETVHLVYGDLHGNVLKVIHFLIRRGVITWKNDEKGRAELFPELCGIYSQINKTFPATQLIERFIHILGTEINYDHTKYIHLIGDELADRGGCSNGKFGNDYLTLLLLHQLQKQA